MRTRKSGSGRRASRKNALISASAALKRIKRTGWQKKVGIIDDCESVADHSYRTALVGVYFAEEFGLDSGKVARMCLIHDLSEAFIGDLMPEEKTSNAEHRSNEDRVMQSILRSLPPRVKKRFLSDWNELIAEKTAEAKLTWQVDKLEMGLQRKEYVKMGYDTEKLKEFDPSRFLSGKIQRFLHRYVP